MSDLPPCPITGRPAKRRVQGIGVGLLKKMWRYAGAGDVSHLFPDAGKIALYESDTGLYFFEPRIAGDADFYTRFYRSHNGHALLEAYPEQRAEYRQVARHCAHGASVLDIGCGNGELGKHLPGCTYCGLDPYAGSDASGSVLRETVDEHLEKARGTYDVVTALQVLEHVADPKSFAAKLVSLLRPGGTLMVAVPLHPSPLTEIPNFLLNAPPHHLTWWSTRALAALADALGLTPIEIAEVPFSPHETLIYRMSQFSRIRAGCGNDERYFAHRWSWHLNLIMSYLLARLTMRWLPANDRARAANVMLIARRPSVD